MAVTASVVRNDATTVQFFVAVDGSIQYRSSTCGGCGIWSDTAAIAVSSPLPADARFQRVSATKAADGHLVVAALTAGTNTVTSTLMSSRLPGQSRGVRWTRLLRRAGVATSCSTRRTGRLSWTARSSEGAIDRGGTVNLASPTTGDLVQTARRFTGQPAIYAREVNMFREAGYVRVGHYMVPG